MTSKGKKTDELSDKTEVVAPAVPAITPAGSLKRVAPVQPASDRIGAQPKRLSKGQRKHLRRQKQASEVKNIRPR